MDRKSLKNDSQSDTKTQSGLIEREAKRKGDPYPGSFDLIQAQSHMATLGVSEGIRKEEK
jgi:hypothetical protein